MDQFIYPEIVVVSPARCGSTWAMDFFEKHEYKNYKEFFRDKCNLDKELLYNTVKTLQQPYCWKIFTDEIEYFDIDVNKLSTNTRWFVYRSNIVEHFISFQVAMHTKQFNRNVNHAVKITDEKIVLVETDYEDYKFMFDSMCSVYKKYDWDGVFEYETLFQELPDLVELIDLSDLVKVSSLEHKLQMFTNTKDTIARKLAESLQIDNVYDYKL